MRAQTMGEKDDGGTARIFSFSRARFTEKIQWKSYSKKQVDDKFP